MIKGTNSNVYVKSIAWKVSKYGVVSGPYFPVFSPNIGNYGPEITPYFDTFHAVKQWWKFPNFGKLSKVHFHFR